MEDVRHAFDSFALEYDAQRDHVIPEFQQFYGAAAWAAESPRHPPRILDIGAGTGTMSGLLLQKYPAATIVLMDFSEKMLDVARQRFAGQPGVEVQGRRLPERGPRGAVRHHRLGALDPPPGTRGEVAAVRADLRGARAGRDLRQRRPGGRRDAVLHPASTRGTGTSTSPPARCRTTSTRGSRHAGTGSIRTTRSPTSSGGSGRPVFTTSTWCTGTGPSSSPRRRSRAVTIASVTSPTRGGTGGGGPAQRSWYTELRCPTSTTTMISRSSRICRMTR